MEMKREREKRAVMGFSNGSGKANDRSLIGTLVKHSLVMIC